MDAGIQQADFASGEGMSQAAPYHRRMRTSICLGLILSLLGGAAQAATLQSATVDSGGLQRQYLLATPDSLPAGPRPLVLVLHGHLGTAANALGGGSVPSPLSAWLDIADREHLLVAAAQGLKGSDGHTGWHDCRVDAVEDPRSDDVAFVETLVNELVRSGSADPRRVYVMGMSNGAMLAYRLALQMRPAPAAIAAVSGGMAAQSECGAAARPASVLMINGTADPIVPYFGGKVGLRGHKTGTVLSAEQGRDFWLRADGLERTPPLRYDFPHRAESGDIRAHKLVYGPDAGPQVEFLSVDNGGHVEPSLRFHYGWLYRQLVGNQNEDFESVEEAWAFFRNKRAP